MWLLRIFTGVDYSGLSRWALSVITWILIEKGKGKWSGTLEEERGVERSKE